MTLLIKSGLDIHSLDNNGRTLLFNPLLADIYILLIEAGCDINHRDHNGQTAFDFLQSSQYDIALACSVHLKDRSPVIFKHLTYASIELMYELNQQEIDFGIGNQCRLSIDENETKEIITIAMKITDLSHVTFCLGHSELPVIKYASESFIKFLIDYNITVDTDLLKDRDLYDEIIQYKRFSSEALPEAQPGYGAMHGPTYACCTGDNRDRFNSAEEIQNYAGVAPLTERSGQKSGSLAMAVCRSSD